MDRDPIQKHLSFAIKILFTVLVLLILVAIVSIEVTKKPPEEVAAILKERQRMQKILAETGQTNVNLPDPWPAVMNKPYPEIKLFDQKGQAFSLSSLKGKVVILEFIDISSPVSQAQSGARAVGAYPFKSQDVDQYARPFSDVLKKNTDEKLTLPHDHIVELKIIVYGEGNAQGSRDDAQNWAEHFGFKRSDNVIVAVPEKDLRGKKSDSLIGGFQLVDRNMILRVDSAGKTPKHNLQMTLAPLVPKLIR